MADDKPLVSVGMPVYNGERFVARALASLLAQDHENLELVISDNGSEDRTQAICLEYAGEDKRIRYYRSDVNRGAVWNFNRVFELSKGEYFMWAGHHDVWDTAFISTCLDALLANPKVVLVYGLAYAIDWNGKPVKVSPDSVDTRDLPPDERFRRVIRDMAWFIAIYGFMRADALRRTSLARNTRGADVVLLSELSLVGEFQFIPKLIYWYNAIPESKGINRTIRDTLVELDPENIRRPLLMRFSTCLIVYNLLSVVKNSALKPAAKARLAADVVRVCSARWRDLIAGELGVRWLLEAIRFGKQLARRSKACRGGM